ncbi:Protein of unknown function [Flexibacter flexilis DSM 6793]|uniref:DUF1648 domain-containing protein n=1 Tax=Flexibacter flexilis DSM 6793 TaxID=927664 RepID=A0A1I1FDW2_9BACT|nr:DUF1648 domain-containing protein [Flexibacter flexilis]SFB97587.1 Protein of unknown function [Flexibacter flexilis DSM 6793]
MKTRNPRPRLRVELTAADRFLEWIGAGILLFLIGFSVFVYLHLPEIIPTHYDLHGQTDANGSKTSIFTLPLVALVLFVGMSILNQYPHNFNYLTEITPENAPQQYKNATQMIRIAKLCIVLIFSLIAVSTYLVANHYIENLTIWLVPVVLLLSFAPLVWFIGRHA